MRFPISTNPRPKTSYINMMENVRPTSEGSTPNGGIVADATSVGRASKTRSTNIAIQIWEKIADWFCHTVRDQAKAILSRIFSPATSAGQRQFDFDILKNLAGPAYQDQFMLLNRDGQKTVMIGSNSISDNVLDEHEVSADDERIKFEIENEIIFKEKTALQIFQQYADKTEYLINGDDLKFSHNHTNCVSSLEAQLKKISCTAGEMRSVACICNQTTIGIVVASIARVSGCSYLDVEVDELRCEINRNTDNKIEIIIFSRAQNILENNKKNHESNEDTIISDLKPHQSLDIFLNIVLHNSGAVESLKSKSFSAN